MKTTRTLLRAGLTAGFLIVGLTARVVGQGSVFGVVERSDLSIPDDGAVCFLGYVGQTDNEVRISGSIGAGYESGHWYDDFQNYLNAPPGAEFTYLFFDTLAGESARLESVIENASYQVEDVRLWPGSWPAPPGATRLARVDDGTVYLYWAVDTTVLVHVYRRVQPSQGSFFRIDDPSGTVSGTGLADGNYSDTTTDYATGYDYLLVAVNSLGEFSEPSVLVSSPANCCGHYTLGYPGNTNGGADGKRNLADITRLIDRVYLSKRYLWCDPDGNTNVSLDQKINLGDITRLIDLVFLSKTELPPCAP